MFLSNGAMDAAAADVRALAAAMSQTLAELDLPSNWSGADADRFQREWHELVQSRLLTAANKLDGISFTELTEGFNG